MYATNQNPKLIGKGVDWVAVLLTTLIVLIGMLCIYAAVYKPDAENPIFTFNFKKNEYTKQVLFFIIAVFVAIMILLVDCRFFPAFANLLFAFGILLMILTIFIGKDINGSKSWIPLGFFNLQPVELCKIFTALALSKYISTLDNSGFREFRTHLIAGAISFCMIGLALLQSELGLALVYLAFFIPLYREGFPVVYIYIFLALILVFIVFVFTSDIKIDSLNIHLSNKQRQITTLILLLAAGSIAYIDRQNLLRIRNLWINYATALIMSLLVIWVVLPVAFKKVLKEYQVTRIFDGFGKPNPYYDATGKAKKTDNYNVTQSVIATGSGRLFGKGFLKGTQTGGDFVPAQHTDFIFSSLGENFGFFGCLILLGLYFGLLFKILEMGERQRSTFSRVYAYSVAGILFFHITINILMAIGLAPVIGITLPLMSYGGSSLLTFTMMIFILIRLDADRNMNLW